jgi:2-polyprenyl-6-methoxyphenol hydroxylase-like FAD-dependent oxidoreductase
MDADVIIVGAGPTGLMLAGELRLAGARPLVLERQPQQRDTSKANGLGGQILQLLRYRGLLERFEAASTDPRPSPGFPFGGVEVDLAHLTDPPLHALQTRAQVALRRGHDQAAEALREVFRELLVDEQPLHRVGALVAAGSPAEART